ncbi:hypothetical protein L2E82_22587 [Cichorium intybus]|uniref:Uncharacterized protein n=1 Tax=Cichorium intybus TaxID=13427 RepID=A0ACB9DXT1_CICIN|nr:hypothetical protein L2E82_22587 [Cichorium intybus]
MPVGRNPGPCTFVMACSMCVPISVPVNHTCSTNNSHYAMQNPLGFHLLLRVLYWNQLLDSEYRFTQLDALKQPGSPMLPSSRIANPYQLQCFTTNQYVTPVTTTYDGDQYYWLRGDYVSCKAEI